MATEPIVSPAVPVPVAFTIPPWLLILLQWIFAKLAPMAAGSMLAGATAGYTINSQLQNMVPTGPGGILKKLLPPPNKAEDAIGLLDLGRSRCTGTIVGPVFDGDAEIDVLTAAHCIKVGQTGVMKMKDGQTLDVRCVTRDAGADYAWCRAARPTGYVPYLLLADEIPPAKAAVWHQGYGIDRPNNRESGFFLDGKEERKQFRYRLSVSPGDSGGGIILAANNRILSPVCCTTKLSGTGDVFGASPLRAAEGRPTRGTAPVSGELVHPILNLPIDLLDEPPLS